MLKNIYVNTFVIIGTIIGAGFASGQEIYTFFNKYGNKGLIGLFISISLIGTIIYKTFKIVLENKINSYEDFLIHIIPSKLKNNKILIFTINNIINIFLLMSFYIMIAGFATYFVQELNISKIIGAMLISGVTFVTASKGIKGITKINSYLIPILIILILFLGINKITTLQIIKNSKKINRFSWILNSVIYTSYNSITLIPILISLSKYVRSKKEAKFISKFTVIIILIISIAIFLLMNAFFFEIKNIEIPIVYIASTLGKNFKYVYGLTILIAIYTTAISTCYGFLTNIVKKRKKYIVLLSIICISSIIIGQISFSKLVNYIYPVFGYLGITQIIFMLLS